MLIAENLQTFEYYYDKLPLYLKNSYGFAEHFRIWFELLKSGDKNGIVNVSETLLYLLDLFDDKYLEKLSQIEGTLPKLDAPQNVSIDTDYVATFDDVPNATGYDVYIDGEYFGSSGDVPTSPSYGLQSDILDKIGLLFGVKRQFGIKYTENAVEVEEDISLNNQDFLLLIKGQIIKNYCEGTFDQIKGFYNSAGLKVYISTTDEGASSHVYLAEAGDYSDNVKKMFKSGLLRIESMGITYTEGTKVIATFMVWDSAKETEYWDEGGWAA